jgi:hypothetical protein
VSNYETLRFGCDEVEQVDLIIHNVVYELTNNERLGLLGVNSHKFPLVLENTNKAILINGTLTLRHLSESIIYLTGCEPGYLDFLCLKELIKVLKSDHIFGKECTPSVFIRHSYILFRNYLLQSGNHTSSDIRYSEMCHKCIEVYSLSLLLLEHLECLIEQFTVLRCH